MAVSRHRTNHVMAPARALVGAASKDRPAVEQRAELLAAAEAGDPAAFLALTAIVDDIRRVQARLERAASAAESGKPRAAMEINADDDTAQRPAGEYPTPRPLSEGLAARMKARQDELMPN